MISFFQRKMTSLGQKENIDDLKCSDWTCDSSMKSGFVNCSSLYVWVQASGSHSHSHSHNFHFYSIYQTFLFELCILIWHHFLMTKQEWFILHFLQFFETECNLLPVHMTQNKLHIVSEKQIANLFIRAVLFSPNLLLEWFR